jgi:tetratricopeptide (TPR) repeat protein
MEAAMKVKELLVALFLVSMLVFPVILGAQEPIRSLNFNYTLVSGKVLDENREPVEGIKLELELAPEMELQRDLNLGEAQLNEAIQSLKSSVGSGIFTTVESDVKGEYRMKGVPIPGVYYIFIRNAKHYLPTRLKLILNASEKKEFLAPEIILRTRKASMGPIIPPKAMKEVEKSRKAMAKKDVKKAIKHMQEALKIEPGYAEGHYNLGVLFMTAKKGKDAVKSMEKAVELNKNYKPALKSLGDLYFAKKDFKKAAQHYSQFLAVREKEGKLTMEDVKIYFRTGNCYRAMKQNDNAFAYFEKYLVAGEKAGKLEKKDARLCNDIAAHSYMKKNMDKSIAFYGKAIQLDPTIGADAYLYLANSYLVKKDGKNALFFYKEYVNRYPKGKSIAQVKAMVDRLQKMYTEK